MLPIISIQSLGEKGRCGGWLTGNRSESQRRIWGIEHGLKKQKDVNERQAKGSNPLKGMLDGCRNRITVVTREVRRKRVMTYLVDLSLDVFRRKQRNRQRREKAIGTTRAMRVVLCVDQRSTASGGRRKKTRREEKETSQSGLDLFYIINSDFSTRCTVMCHRR